MASGQAAGALGKAVPLGGWAAEPLVSRKGAVVAQLIWTAIHCMARVSTKAAIWPLLQCNEV